MKNLICLSALCLFVGFIARAQPKMVFDKVQHDFGKVNEGDGAVSYDFTFKNTGTKPLIIQDVKTTCGCTTPEWSKQPIVPGAAGFIKVSYDVKGRPGVIDKTITVHGNSSPSKSELRIIGEVVPVDRHPSEAFRYTAGTIRMDDLHAAFGRVYTYEKPTLIVTAYNPGPDPVKISFVNLPAHIRAEVQPASVPKGEKASIKITYDAAKKNDWGFVSDQISMILNGNKAKDYKLTVTATVEEDFSRWSAAQLQNAPSVVFDKTVIEAGKVKKGEKKEYRLKLANNGKGKLQIRKAEPSDRQLSVTAPKEINAGASAELIIVYDAVGEAGVRNKTVTVITNDPKNATVTIRLKAEVTE